MTSFDESGLMMCVWKDNSIILIISSPTNNYLSTHNEKKQRGVIYKNPQNW